MDKDNFIESIVILVVVGALIGLGQLLASTEKLTGRVIVGRLLSSGGLALASASLLQFVPDISLFALVGVSAVLASLGTSFLEKIINKFMFKSNGK